MPRLAHPRAVVLILAIAPLVAYAVLRVLVTEQWELPGVHVLAVGGSALAATLASVLLTTAAIGRNDTRAGLVGVAFTIMAGLLLIHGLATPGFLMEEYGRNATVGLAGVAAVPAAAVILAVAMLLPPVLRGGRSTVLRAQVAAVVLLAAFGGVGLIYPALVPLVPLMVEPWVYVVLLPTLVVYAVVARRAYHTSRLTRRRTDLWVAVGMTWLGVSLALYLLSAVWSVGFWWAHLMEGLGVLAVAGSVAVDLARQHPSRSLIRSVRGTELVEEDLLGGYVRALASSLRDHDHTTGEHSRRVARLAVRVGERLGLGPDGVRRLAVAGLVHDIGKLQVPMRILRKPGPLTDEEFDVVKRHPRDGAALLEHLGGFEAEAPIVCSHHERWDGRGYPEGLGGESIPLEARILTVCDVYDALINPRTYRAAWDVDRAVALLRHESGSAFDPACVAALLAVLADESPVVELRRVEAGRRPAVA